jgi:hypothetical protein
VTAPVGKKRGGRDVNNSGFAAAHAGLTC